MGVDHISRIEIGEEPTNLDDNIPDAQVFVIKMVDDYYEDIVQFLNMRRTLK